MPEISVIVPVYKVEPYLHRCVDSILNQTYSDFELILVDDGSPDRCGAICDDYAGKDSRIHVIHQENGGLSAARNAGLDWIFAHSDSKWVTFVDSDDWVHPCYLETLYRVAINTGTKISQCGYAIAKEEGEIEYLLESPWNTVLWDPETLYMQRIGNCILAWGKLYFRDLFSDLRYPVGRIHEDVFITWRLIFKVPFIAILDASLYYYYQSPQSITHSSWSLRRLDALDGVEEQAQLFYEANRRNLCLCSMTYLMLLLKRMREQLKKEPMPWQTRREYQRVLRKRVRKALRLFRIYHFSLREDLRLYAEYSMFVIRLYELKKKISTICRRRMSTYTKKSGGGVLLSNPRGPCGACRMMIPPVYAA